MRVRMPVLWATRRQREAGVGRRRAWPVSIIVATYIALGMSEMPCSEEHKGSGEQDAYSSADVSTIVSETSASDVDRISRLTKSTRPTVRTALAQRAVLKSRQMRKTRTQPSEGRERVPGVTAYRSMTNGAQETTSSSASHEVTHCSRAESTPR